MDLFLILLKKEFLDFYKKKQNLFLLIFIALFLIIAPFFSFNLPNERVFTLKNNGFICVILTSVVVISQIFFDGCKNDFQNGGTLFLINLNAGIVKSAWAKSFIAGLVWVFLFFINSFELYKTLSFVHIPWIFCFYIFIGLLSYLMAMFARQSSFLIFVVDEVLGLVFFVILLFFRNPVVNFLLSFIVCLICLWLLKHVYNSKPFRIMLN